MSFKFKTFTNGYKPTKRISFTMSNYYSFNWHVYVRNLSPFFKYG